MKRAIKVLGWGICILALYFAVCCAVMASWGDAFLLMLISAAAYPPIAGELAKRKLLILTLVPLIGIVILLVIAGMTRGHVVSEQVAVEPPAQMTR